MLVKERMTLREFNPLKVEDGYAFEDYLGYQVVCYLEDGCSRKEYEEYEKLVYCANHVSCRVRRNKSWVEVILRRTPNRRRHVVPRGCLRVYRRDPNRGLKRQKSKNFGVSLF